MRSKIILFLLFQPDGENPVDPVILSEILRQARFAGDAGRHRRSDPERELCHQIRLSGSAPENGGGNQDSAVPNQTGESAISGRGTEKVGRDDQGVLIQSEDQYRRGHRPHPQ